jgi:hypothetical protein
LASPRPIREDPDVIKKILKHLGLWDMKQKPRPTANAPPIDVFPVYDEQPGPSIDDPSSVWILRRDKLHQGSGLPCRGLLLKKPHPGSKASYAQNPSI